ncbi:MAG: HAD-IC family P-type ATPase, partial [Gammaproteobacteria bacterium]|nr:HAD-IC family P-type ATPase [Gammaproteobacteria bacterium]
MRAWHSTGVADSLSALAVEAGTGLGGGEAAARTRRHGENRLDEPPPRPAWRSFADQFASLLILVLLGAAVLAAAVGDHVEALVILFVVFLNAALGFWQEHRAEATLAELKQMLAPVARVRRDGELREMPAAALVPGDIVLLAAGDRVPADGRLIETHGDVEIDESALTGESQPVAKEAGATAAEGAALAERPNMAFMNTVVTRGRAEMAVTAIGMATEMGRVSGLLAQTETDPTPLQRQLDVLGHKLTLIAGVVIAVIFALGLGRGDPLIETLITSIALAVAAIPEGLPAVVTVTLAIGMHRMARRRALVKRLAAVETLGCTTVICADKTGTLTMNRMTVRAVYAAGRRFRVTGADHGGDGGIEAEDGAGAALPGSVLRPAVLANDSRLDRERVVGDPMEGALLVLAARGGLDV